MGFRDKLLKAATGMGPVDDAIERTITRGRQLAGEGMTSATLTVSQRDVGTRNILEQQIPRIIDALQNAGIPVLSAEGGTGWDRTLRLHVDLTRLVAAAGGGGLVTQTTRPPVPAAAVVTPPPAPTDFGEPFLMAPATLESQLFSARGGEEEDLEEPARLEVCDGGLRIRTQHRVAFEVAWSEITSASYIWKVNRMQAFGGGPESFLTYEFVKATSDGGSRHVLVSTGGPGFDDSPSPAGMCLLEIRDRTNLVRWRDGIPTQARMVGRLGESLDEVPSDWVPAVPVD